MRDNYVGDEGDYAKYALLRAIHEHTGMRLGVNWYRTVHHEENGDGGRRRHLVAPRAWEALDRELLDRLIAVVGRRTPSELRVSLIERGGILPEDTSFFEAALPGPDVPVGERLPARRRWHADALERLAEAEIVFLDPDNGLQAPHMTTRNRRASKYAFEAEVADHLRRGRSVVLYQHQPRLRWPALLARYAPRLHRLPGAPTPAIVTFGQRGFFLLAPAPEARARMLDAARALKVGAEGRGWDKLPIVIHDGAADLVEMTDADPAPPAAPRLDPGLGRA